MGDYLYRIQDATRVIQYLETGRLYFAHPSQWEDPYESVLKHKHSNRLFAQCWCKNGVSDAMWRIYSPTHLGIRIRVQREKFEAQIAKAIAGSGYAAQIRDVEYLRQSELEERLPKLVTKLRAKLTPAAASASLFMKRKAYAHEAEVRAVIYTGTSKMQLGTKALLIAVPPEEIVESLLFDPRAPDEFVNALSYYFKQRLKFRGRIGKSSLYTTPDQLEV